MRDWNILAIGLIVLILISGSFGPDQPLLFFVDLPVYGLSISLNDVLVRLPEKVKYLDTISCHFLVVI